MQRNDFFRSVLVHTEFFTKSGGHLGSFFTWSTTSQHVVAAVALLHAVIPDVVQLGFDQL